MKVQWKTLFIKSIFWLVTESVFGFAGLDTIADYSEYFWEKQFLARGLSFSSDRIFLYPFPKVMRDLVTTSNHGRVGIPHHHYPV